MDEAFLQELDAHITNVGTDKCWKRVIGGLEIWFSPIPYTAQIKANETIVNENLGTAAVQETKRIALSHSIVGFDKFDLRKYRNAGPTFPMAVTERGRDGESVRKFVKVELSKYIYEKIAGWDSELVDLAFEVFADLMESNKKEAVKDVKFENAKEPADELAELEIRASEIREQLGMPQMVEASGESNELQFEEPGRDLQEQEPSGLPEQEPERDPEPTQGEDFDPFRTVQKPVDRPDPEPVRSVPVPEPQPRKMSAIDLELERRGQGPVAVQPSVQPAIPAQVGSTSSPDRPYEAQPSVDVGVVEQQGERKVVDPPKIDRKPGGQSKNPRFNPTRRT